MTRAICYCYIHNEADLVSYVDDLIDAPCVTVVLENPSLPPERTRSMVHSSASHDEHALWRLPEVRAAVCELDTLITPYGTPWVFDDKLAQQLAQSYRETLPRRLSNYVEDRVEQTIHVVLFWKRWQSSWLWV
jgi:hypothetical protein